MCQSNCMYVHTCSCIACTNVLCILIVGCELGVSICTWRVVRCFVSNVWVIVHLCHMFNSYEVHCLYMLLSCEVHFWGRDQMILPCSDQRELKQGKEITEGNWKLDQIVELKNARSCQNRWWCNSILERPQAKYYKVNSWVSHVQMKLSCIKVIEMRLWWEIRTSFDFLGGKCAVKIGTWPLDWYTHYIYKNFFNSRVRNFVWKNYWAIRECIEFAH